MGWVSEELLDRGPSEVPKSSMPMTALQEVSNPPEDLEEIVKEGWQLKKLTPKHKQVCALLAQGMKQVTIAQVCGVTAVYVNMLTKQPLCMQYIAEMSVVTNIRLEAMFEKSVDTIADAMDNGNISERLKGARLQLEATKRIGRHDNVGLSGTDGMGKLESLAERLVGLLKGANDKVVHDGDAEEIPDADFRDISGNAGG